MESDEELLTAWRAGDDRAGSKLFHRHFRGMKVYFANKVDASDLEDIVQETFLACLRRKYEMAERATVASYLFGIARNLVCQYWRARSRHHVEDIEEHAIASLGAGPSSIIARNEDEARLVAALRQIPLKHQTVLELHYWGGLNGIELGAALGVPEATARSKLKRAKDALGKEYRRVERFGLRTSDEEIEQQARDIRMALDPDDEPPLPEPA
jgi:RNA polymerase sigma-70 factor (ECF subfamily)